MSENAAPTRLSRAPDRRSIHTRDRLGGALLKLLRSKPLEEISVQEVLALAKVSRSTFYEHYRDKLDLLLSDADEFFAAMGTLLERRGDRSERLAPVAEFFAHVAESRELVAGLVQSGHFHDLRELGEAHFARGIVARLARRDGIVVSLTDAAARTALAHALAGSLFGLLLWWLREGPAAATPAQVDALFHRLANGQAAWNPPDTAAAREVRPAAGN